MEKDPSSFTEIPVIDIWAILNLPRNDERYIRTANEIGDACKNVGFFYIKNHGIPTEMVMRTFECAKEFFELSLDKKKKVSIANSTNHRGYFGVGEEVLDEADADLKEGIDIGLELPDDDIDVVNKTPNYGPNQWPSDLPLQWKNDVLEYFDAGMNLGRKLIASFAVYLKLDEDYFTEMYKKPITILRFLKYPPNTQKQFENQLGCGAHTDYGFLTILVQDTVGGLQVQNTEGKWIDAKPIEGTFVINVGDMMPMLTNDLFRATSHRVISPYSESNRYSIPLFFDPHYNTTVECLQSCISKENPAKYPPVIYGEHLLQRLNATYTYRKKET